MTGVTGAAGADCPTVGVVIELGSRVTLLGAPVEMGVTAEFDRQQVEPRVEPDDELRALALDRLRNAVAEALDGWRRLHLHRA
jgi:hypothetical protein